MNNRDVFVVEDDITARAILTVVLTKAGYRVTSFFDGHTLVAAVRQRRPHCVLLDVCLPGRSGLDVLKDLKAVDPVRVMMISGHGTVDTAVQALKDGATDFIQKPFRLHDLLTRVGHQLKLEPGQALAG